MKKIFEIIENFNFKSWVLFCISLSILLRFAIVIYFFPDQNYLTYSDQSKYIYRSNLILSGIFFSEEWGVLRMPGYPIFLSIIKLFFNNFFFIILIQNLLLFFTYYYIIKLKNFFPHLSIKIFVLTFSVSINVILYSQLILTEAIILPLSIILFYFIFEQYYSFHKSNYLKIAIIFSLISLIRPQFVYLSPLIIVFPLFIRGEKNKIKNCFKLFIIFFIIINSWLIRNVIVYDSYSLTASKIPNIVGWYIPIIDQKYSDISFNDAVKKSEKRWQIYKNNIDNKDKDNLFVQDQYAFDFFNKSFDKFPLYEIIYTWTYGSIKTLFTPGIVELSYWLKIKKSNFSSIESKSIFEQVIKYIFKNENKYYGVLLFISLLVIFIIRTISLFSLKFFINQKNSLIFIYLLLLIIMNLFLVGPLGSARYRLFIDPILILFFSIGLEQLLKYYKKYLN